MNKIYSIILREVGKSTGKISTRVCKRGTSDVLCTDITMLGLRSMFNEDLTYYLALQENEEQAVKELQKRIVRKSNLYERV